MTDDEKKLLALFDRDLVSMMDRHFETIKEQLDQNFAELRQIFVEGFDRMDRRFDQVERHLDDINGIMDRIEGHLDLTGKPKANGD
jgi:tetrahydromethanopterin S-methyltransferase subunit G